MFSFETTWSRSSLLWWVTSEPGTYSAILVKLLTLAWNAEGCWSIAQISKTHQHVQNNQTPHPADSLQLVWFSKSWLFPEKRIVGPTQTETGLQPAQWLDGYSLPSSPTCQQAYITFWGHSDHTFNVMDQKLLRIPQYNGLDPISFFSVWQNLMNSYKRHVITLKVWCSL